ncbi:hypothetical protein JXA85_01310 [Candidatus Woesearchaeota archaeon]|nr:hypothetical protein [Candidatus Woesearchaeota archaeon]
MLHKSGLFIRLFIWSLEYGQYQQILLRIKLYPLPKRLVARVNHFSTDIKGRSGNYINVKIKRLTRIVDYHFNLKKEK